MAGSLAYRSYYNSSRERIIPKQEDDLTDWIPMQNMGSRENVPFQKKATVQEKDKWGNGKQVRDGNKPGPSSLVAWSFPLERDEPSTSSAVEAPTPPTPPTSPRRAKTNRNNNNNGNNDNSSGTGTIVQRGIDKFSYFFILYTTLIQSLLKMTACVYMLSIDISADPACDGQIPCITPVYSHSHTAHFLVALALFSLSTINFITGLCICMQSSRSMIHDQLVGPMKIFAAVLGLEILVLIMATQVVVVTMLNLMFVLLVMVTELLAILIVFLYPHSYYQGVENPPLLTAGEGEGGGEDRNTETEYVTVA